MVQFYYTGNSDLSILSTVLGEEDIEGMQRCQSDLVDYLNYKSMIDLGINVTMSEIDHYKFLIYKTIRLKMEELRNGKPESNL